MVKLYLCVFSCVFLCIFNSQAKINVFACEPEWKALAEEIGQDRLNAYSATSAFQDPHYIKAKPSLLSKVRKSDLLICSGADLESGWLPLLLRNASRNLQPGNIGNLMAAEYVETIGKPEILDRSMGDVHADGNPHIHLNPYNILLVAAELNNRLKEIDPSNSKDYQKNYDIFISKWKKSIGKWEVKASKLKGVKVLPHHKSFSYLIEWLKLDEVSSLESKPGIAPTSNHLESLLIILRKEPEVFIIRTPFDPTDASNWIHTKTHIKALVLPYTVGGNEESNNLFSLFDNNVDLMLEATK